VCHDRPRRTPRRRFRVAYGQVLSDRSGQLRERMTRSQALLDDLDDHLDDATWREEIAPQRVAHRPAMRAGR
jgi:hypothetical protein